MLEFFTNPGFLAVGGALVSAPIIIHLINRMRFKRVRWAAMEFLLKSQKRSRRRLLIEQIILLALRCLLVLLATLLVSRFVGFSFDRFSSKANVHLVLLDDTLSMNDQWKENDLTRNCFDVAKEDVILKQIVRNVGQSSTQDRLMLLQLVKLTNEPGYEPKSYTRLNETKPLEELKEDLKKINATKVHVNVREGLERLQPIIDQNIKDSRLTLHIVSDFRQRDWGKPAADELHKQLVKLANNGVKIRLVDTAHPYRVEGQGGIPISHDNVAIVDLRPSTRVAGVNMPVNFTITLANYGTQDTPVHVAIHEAIKGEELKQVDLKLPTGQENDLGPGVVMVPAGSTETTASFELRFPPDVAPGQKVFGQIFARLENKARGKLDKDGLNDDNVRFTAVEVRNKVPLLVVDGESEAGREEGKDSFFIEKAITSVPGNSYEVVYADKIGGIKALEQVDLRQYPTIFFLNVRDFDPKSRQLKSLEGFIREGGGAAFFLGPRVASDYYNEQLYKNGAGLFPMPLGKSFYPPPSDEPLKADFTGFPQLLLRDESFPSMDAFPIFGPILADERDMAKSFVDLPVKRYFKVSRNDWRATPGKVFELATLPNNAPITDYQQAALDIVRNPALAKALENPQLEKYKRGIEKHRRAIEDAVAPTSDKKAIHLAEALQRMLDDRGDKKDPVLNPNLTEFWSYPDPKIRSIVQATTRLIEDTKYGDPFIVAGNFGAGKVVAVTSTAGKEWNEWGGGSYASVVYQPFIWELQNYLSAPSQETVLNVGQPVTINIDREQYTKKSQLLKMQRFHQKAEANVILKQIKDTELFGVDKGEQLVFTFARTGEPGLYVSKLFGDNDSKPLAEWGHVYNVDSASEGRLDRVSLDELSKNLLRATEKEGQIRFETPQALGEELVNRQADLSEWVLFYLAIMFVLVVEQALAVHLSFHLRGGEAQAPAAVAQSTRAA